MVYFSLFHSVFLLPLLGPGVALALLLAFSAGRRPQAAGLLVALLVLLPVFVLAQCLLSTAGWCVAPLDPAQPGPLYLPWPTELLLAPVSYLYLRVLTNPRLRAPGAGRHLLPGLAQMSLFAGVAVLGLGYRHGAAAGYPGALSPALALLGYVVAPLALVCYVSLLRYGLRTLDDYRRYRHYLDAERSGAERWRLLSQRSLLLVLIAGFGLGLSFVALDAWLGPFHYSEIWYAFVVRGGLVFGLAVVGLQAGYVAAVGRPRLELAGAAGPGSWAGAATAWAAQAGPGSPKAPWPAAAGNPARTGAGPELTEAAAPLPPELLALRERLLALMATGRPYLQPELSLTELAQRLRTNPSLLSKIINTGCGQSFSDFVNSYRVAEARRKLQDPRFAHYSVLGVALESGFNSKSTFNRVFKKLTGQAPGEVARPA
ncbi:helix-turn-helix transcriptional regulator [uncultured Hymenobacter sp.]|uniref:helix-turn-helix transcriptional regulator n=1 Tax=uncultured Hymenobacter sp. TaxID=170016 RepID=UPI0035CC894F